MRWNTPVFEEILVDFWFVWLVVWLVGPLVGCLVGWLVGWLFFWCFKVSTLKHPEVFLTGCRPTAWRRVVPGGHPATRRAAARSGHGVIRAPASEIKKNQRVWCGGNPWGRSIQIWRALFFQMGWFNHQLDHLSLIPKVKIFRAPLCNADAIESLEVTCRRLLLNAWYSEYCLHRTLTGLKQISQISKKFHFVSMMYIAIYPKKSVNVSLCLY